MSKPIPEQSQQDPTEEEKIKAEKAREKAVALAQEVRRDNVEAVLTLHGAMIEKLNMATSALETASAMSEELRGYLRKRRPIAASEDDREALRIMFLKLEQMLGMTDVVRTVNAARMHVSRINRRSAAMSKAVKEWTDELVRPDLKNIFE